MNKLEMNQVVLGILREEKRSGQIISTANVLDYITDIVSAVDVDRKYLQNGIKEILHTNPKNPLNAILGLVGLQVVRKEDALSIDEPRHGNSGSKLDSLLKLDEKALKKTVAAVAGALASFEKEAADDRSSKVDKINELITNLDEKERKVMQLSVDAQSQFQTVASRTQYMLSLIGSEKSDSQLEQQLYELLTDIEIEVHWNSEGAPFNEAAMFTELKTDDVAQHKIKPCLVCRGEVVAKGLRFVGEGTTPE